MIVLDTDYLTLLERKGSPTAQFIYQELSQRQEPHTTTIVSYEEQMRGWLDYIAKAKTFTKQVEGYQFLHRNLQLFCGLPLLLFDGLAARKFQDLRIDRIGS